MQATGAERVLAQALGLPCALAEREAGPDQEAARTRGRERVVDVDLPFVPPRCHLVWPASAKAAHMACSLHAEHSGAW